jgi:aminoglycoside phosphotransferase (APT) family kinase protein
VETANTDLDIEQPGAALRYLRGRDELDADETPTVTVLPGGVSSRAVLVRSDRRAWVMKQALAKLRVPVDWFSDPLRVHREASALRWWAKHVPGAAPDLVFEDEREHIVCMSAVPFPHENWKSILLAGIVDAGYVRQFAATLARVHVHSAARLAELEEEFGDRRFFETLRLEPYYGFAASQVPVAAPFLRRLQADTRVVRATLVHGDYSPKNALAESGRLWIVDHEVSHLGDPAFDLGFSSAHLLSKAHHVVEARERFLDAARAYWRWYSVETRAEPWYEGLEKRAVRHTLGCTLARVAGRSQLEYMSEAEKVRQRDMLLPLLETPPSGFNELVDAWREALR